MNFNPLILSFDKIWATQHAKPVELNTWLDSVCNCVNTERIFALRKHPYKTSPYNILKEQFPGACFNGLFKTGETIENATFIKSSGLVTFDLDEIEDDVDIIKEIVKTIPFVVFVFVSPSGIGLKGAVRVNPERIQSSLDYTKAWKQIEALFALYGLKLDTSGKDVSRKAFASQDNLLYRNLDAPIFELAPFPIEIEPVVLPTVAYSVGPYRDAAKHEIEMVLRNAVIGERHAKRLIAAKLAGGFVAGGVLQHDEAWEVLTAASEAVMNKNISEKDKRRELKALSDGFKTGVSLPIYTAGPEAINTTMVNWDSSIPELGAVVWPDFSTTGKGQATIENLREMLKLYGITYYYDELLKRQFIMFPWGNVEVDNADEANLEMIKSLLAKNSLPKETSNRLTFLFAEKTINPIRDWIVKTPWDGINRLPELYETINTEDNDYRDTIMKRWLLQCVAAMDGCKHGANSRARAKYELVLVLQGEQGTKKTSWFRRLVPRQYDEYILDGIHLDPSDKDSVSRAVGCWISELGELDSTFKKDIAKLKGFLSNTVDILRLPYDKTNSRMQRRTSFCASVNDSKFLVDETGNRRFVVIPVTHVNAWHNVDMQQLWAQVWEIYRAGEQWWLTDTENLLQAISNQNHEFIDPVEDAIASYFDLSIVNGTERLSCTDIAKRCDLQINKSTLNSVGRILRKFGFIMNQSSNFKYFTLTSLTVSNLIKM